MEYKLNAHSSTSLEALQQKMHEDRLNEEAEIHRKKLARDMAVGFKSVDDIIRYLKDGNVIGDFLGGYGEYNMDNDFLIWDDVNNDILRRYQYSYDDCVFRMEFTHITVEEFTEWVERLEQYKDENGILPTTLFHKNQSATVQEIKNFYNL